MARALHLGYLAMASTQRREHGCGGWHHGLVKSAAFFLAFWVATLPAHRWLSRHPEWDGPADQGLRVAVATGRIVLPVAAIVALITGQP
jgi:hypothetical protein